MPGYKNKKPKGDVCVTLLLYGPPDRMNALLAEEKLRMANGERSPLESFTQREFAHSTDPQTREWVSFRVDVTFGRWDPDNPWVCACYRLMNRLLDSEKRILTHVDRDLSDMVSFEFMRVDARDLSRVGTTHPVGGMIEVIRTHYHDGELAVRLQITT